eukprot:365852-Chlamydomonas_euryale.AAC.5
MFSFRVGGSRGGRRAGRSGSGSPRHASQPCARAGAHSGLAPRIARGSARRACACGIRVREADCPPGFVRTPAPVAQAPAACGRGGARGCASREGLGGAFARGAVAVASPATAIRAARIVGQDIAWHCMTWHCIAWHCMASHGMAP